VLCDKVESRENIVVLTTEQPVDEKDGTKKVQDESKFVFDNLTVINSTWTLYWLKNLLQVPFTVSTILDINMCITRDNSLINIDYPENINNVK